jgi:outer membrane lipoprotein-sorting protein
MEPITILIIATIILGLIAITAGIVAFVALNKSNSSSDIQQLQKNMDEFQASIEKVVVSQAQALNSGTRGLQGPRGPSGSQGPPGMSYSAAGQLLNMATKTVATPTAGKGQNSIIYLDSKNNSPLQYWFLENNPDGSVRVKNKYSEKCLNTDGGNNVFSEICSKENNNMNEQFIWNSQMQLQSKSQNGKCMTIQEFTRTTGNSTNSLDMTTGQPLANTNNGNVKKVALDTCSSSINPNQTWFVGN